MPLLALIAGVAAVAGPGYYLPAPLPPERISVWQPGRGDSAREYRPALTPAERQEFLDSMRARHAAARRALAPRPAAVVPAAVVEIAPTPVAEITLVPPAASLAAAPVTTAVTVQVPALFTRPGAPATFDLLAPIARATMFVLRSIPAFKRRLRDPFGGAPELAPDGLSIANDLVAHRRPARLRPSFLSAPARRAHAGDAAFTTNTLGAPPVRGGRPDVSAFLPPASEPAPAMPYRAALPPVSLPPPPPGSLPPVARAPVLALPVAELAPDLLDPLARRVTELRDQLLATPARSPEQLAALEAVVGQLEDMLRAGRAPGSWAYAFAVKARLFLALVDRARAAQHLLAGQTWLDQLCPEQEPMIFRNSGGVRVVTRGDASRPEIALTFDGGPSQDTPALLDYLRAEGVHGTWFLLGCFASKDPVTSKRIADEGHVIANHTMTHAKWRGLAKISAQDGDREIEEGQRVIAAACGTTQHMDLFRPPYGSGAETEWVNRIIGRYHRYSIMWTIDSLDSMGANLDKQIRRVLTSPKLSGAIILTHDHSKSILPLIRTIVPELKRRGYRFVTVPELLVAGEARLRGERFAELCVAVQEGRIGAAFLGAQRAAKSGRTDRLTAEAADLALMIRRLFPTEVQQAVASQPIAPASQAASPGGGR